VIESTGKVVNTYKRIKPQVDEEDSPLPNQPTSDDLPGVVETKKWLASTFTKN
jgi:hypothetical protein